MSSAALAHSAGFPSLAAPFALPAFDRRDRHIGIAIVVSLLVHGIVLGWLPGLNRPASEAPPLQVRLPVPVLRAEPAAVPPAPTFEPTPRVSRREAAPVLREVAPVVTRSASESPQQTPAIRAADPPAATSLEVARAAAEPTPARPATPDAGVLAAYGRELAGAVATRQRYPRLAQLRQWQGTAVLQLELAAAGGLLAVRVLSSSGHEILDRQALEMVREAVPLPPLPDALAGRPLTVDVPVVFRLAS